jgi:stress-induced morphogen
MGHTVKFRLRADEFDMLQKIARQRALSQALRDLIHDEYNRSRGK